MLRELLVSNLFSFKKGSSGRGDAWEAIADTLNQVNSPTFRIKDKRGVRERWVLLQRKYKKKPRNKRRQAE